MRRGFSVDLAFVVASVVGLAANDYMREVLHWRRILVRVPIHFALVFAVWLPLTLRWSRRR